MKSIDKSSTARFISGFLILLPLLLCYLMIGQLFDGMMALTAPISDLLPKTIFEEEWIHRLTAAALLILLCFLIGQIAETRLGKNAGKWIENKTLNRFPPYVILRNFSKALSGSDVPGKLKPGLLELTPGSRTLCFIIEEHTSDIYTVFLPLSPTPGIGTLQIVSKAKVQQLEASTVDALGCLLNWGAGTEALLRSEKIPPKSSETL